MGLNLLFETQISMRRNQFDFTDAETYYDDYIFALDGDDCKTEWALDTYRDILLKLHSNLDMNFEKVTHLRAYSIRTMHESGWGKELRDTLTKSTHGTENLDQKHYSKMVSPEALMSVAGVDAVDIQSREFDFPHVLI